MDFSALKKRSKSSIDKLNAEVEKMKSGSNQSYEDDRFWKPTVDQAGNASATIRFLPEPTHVDGDEASLWVRVWSHGFKGDTGSWYIENCLTTIPNTQDPCAEYNSRLWNSGVESDKDIARRQKRKLSYYSNIMVVDDPANPDNNGKVFMFRYGQQIFDIMEPLWQPEEADDPKVDPFDPLNGCDFRLRQIKKADFPNYQKSSFGPQGRMKLKGKEMTDEEIVDVCNKTHSLNALIDPNGDNFKSYDELLKRLNRVVGFDTQRAAQPQAQAPAPMPEVDDEIPDFPAPAADQESTDPMKFFEDLESK